ncbi:YfhO family protein [bacterium]|nr:YfhO family protein [bacterium]
MTDLLKYTKSKGFIYFLSFLIPILLMLIVCALIGVYPFGHISYNFTDSDMQAIPYLGYFKSLITTNNDYVYSFFKAGGNGMFDFNSCYINKPLNFIAFLFPDNRIDIAYQTITMIKIGLCGLAFNYFLSYRKDYDCKTLIFSTAYALSTCAIFFSQNVIGFEGMIFLPFAIVGIEKLIREEKYLLYTLTCTAAFIVQPYCAWVILLFSFLWFIYFYSLNVPENPKKVILNYIISNVFIIALSLFITLPVWFALEGTKYKLMLPRNLLLFKLGDFLPSFYTGITLKNFFYAAQIPLIYAGILPFILLISYFFNSAIKRKERLITLLFVSLLIFMSSWHVTFTLFNGGNVYPRGCIYRFMFIFIFLMLFISFKSFSEIKNLTKKNILFTSLIYLLITLFVYFEPREDIHPMIILFDLFFGIAVIALLWGLKQQKQKLFLIILGSLVFLHFSELIFNAGFCFKLQEGAKISTPEYFRQRYDDLSGIISDIKKADSGFYRIETDEVMYKKLKWVDTKWSNLPLLLHYNGISHYSSLGNLALRHTYDRLGFDIFPFNNIILYNDNMTAFPVSLTGIKYIISSKEEHINPYIKLKEYDAEKPLYLYENPFALPIVFISEKEILNEDLTGQENIFEAYNSIAKALSGEDFGNIYNIFEIADVNYGLFKSYANMNFKVMTEEKIWLTQEGHKIDKYTYLTLNDKVLRSFDASVHFNLEYLGKYNKGDDLNLVVYRYPTLISDTETRFFYASENTDILKEYFDEIRNKPCTVKEITSSHLEGNFTTTEDEQVLSMTIPFDENWEIKIDGQKVSQQRILGAMTGILVPNKGQHTFEMRYKVKGFKTGILISLISLLFFLLYLKKNKNY